MGRGFEILVSETETSADTGGESNFLSAPQNINKLCFSKKNVLFILNISKTIQSTVFIETICGSLYKNSSEN